MSRTPRHVSRTPRHVSLPGELRVEILESDGLPSMDAMPLDENDVYALVLFEDVVARTSPIKGAPQQQRHDNSATTTPHHVPARLQSLGSVPRIQ